MLVFGQIIKSNSLNTPIADGQGCGPVDGLAGLGDTWHQGAGTSAAGGEVAHPGYWHCAQNNCSTHFGPHSKYFLIFFR